MVLMTRNDVIKQLSFVSSVQMMPDSSFGLEWAVLNEAVYSRLRSVQATTNFQISPKTHDENLICLICAAGGTAFK
jgi:hypothetical protein